MPGVFTFLGIRNESAGSIHNVHTSRFMMDETQMAVGAALHAAMAVHFLNTHKQPAAAHSEL